MPYSTPKLVYEADPSHVETVRSLREKLHGVCKHQLMNKYVKVQTLDGHEYEGVIVFVDGGQIYLSLAEDEHSTRFFPYPNPYQPFSPTGAILPLVLYDLLVITLLYT